MSLGLVRLLMLVTLNLQFSTYLFAGVADLEISITTNISDGVVFGQAGNFSITITNHGPDIAGLDSGFDSPIRIDSPLIYVGENGFLDVSFLRNNSIAQGCFFVASVFDPIPGEPVAFAFTFVHPVIAVNESVSCYGLFGVGFEEGQRAIEWDVAVRGNTFTDPNPENDRATMLFKINPPVIPTLSIWGVLLLILAVLGLLFRHNRTLKT
ncbi:MAG: hypothetical protein L3J52_07070 [Proteobacteria bacterium]|nr:hypothetical protein [Pseudomonadota bacterium]